MLKKKSKCSGSIRVPLVLEGRVRIRETKCVKKEIEVFRKYKSAFDIRGPCSDKRNKMC